MKKLRHKLRDWLLKDEFEKYEQTMSEMKLAYENLEDKYQMVTDLMQVGVDHHCYHPENNWAVICVGGKNEYVRFARFNAKDIREVQGFLKHFEKRNTRVDSMIPTELLWRF